MACKTCRSQARLLAQAATRTTKAPTATAALLATRQYLTTGLDHYTKGRKIQTRSLSTTAPRALLDSFGSGTKSAYMVVGATERLYKVCGEAADYRITDEERSKDAVVKLEDGEEVGHSMAKQKVWHELFKLPPTFSTWSHVTMLHLYLLNARVRCFERDAFANWRHQLVDHFFFEAEKKMHVDHSITSSALRQRYLKDIFVQWRGVMVAYDEGLVKGDAVLASAVWRNLFKGSPDVDPRALAAIVGWMRACLKSLEATSDMSFPSRAGGILELPVESFWAGIEKASKVTPPAGESAGPKKAAKPTTAPR